MRKRYDFSNSVKNVYIKNIDKKDEAFLDDLFDDSDLDVIQSMEESIIEALNEPDENYVTADKLEW